MQVEEVDGADKTTFFAGIQVSGHECATDDGIASTLGNAIGDAQPGIVVLVRASPQQV